jgi:DNA helicase-2/ATP-dependent DNA helicase PcrA
VVGDGDQCIVEGMKVETPKGKVNIEDLNIGDSVYSAGGCGKVMVGNVDTVMKTKYQGPIINVKTESGKELKLTPNHIMFSKLNPEPGVFYIYLMYKKELGYRIGQTQGVRSFEKGEIKNGLIVRMNQENGDKAWILKVCNSREEAVYYETLYSTKYSIPTVVFHPRGRRISLTQNTINKLFNEIDTRTNVIKLMDDLLIFEEYPQVRQAAVVRKGILRRIVNLTYFGGRPTGLESGWHSHRINFNTSGDKLEEKAIGNNFNVRKGQRNTWRIETERKDYDEAYKLAGEIITLEEDIEINKRARLSKCTTFNFMPASHIKPSMSIAVHSNGEIIEEIVKEVSVEQYDGFVYDISVPNLRQFVCEGIVVHNSIYGWRGADISNIRDFEKDYKGATTILLEQNYRSTQNILQLANKVIKNNPSRKDKNLWTDNHEGETIAYEELPDAEDEALFVVNKIDELIKEGYKPSDCAILYRTNAQSRSFEESFIRKAIPYKIVGGLKFYDRKEIKDIVAYLKVIENPVDNISLKRIINTPRRGIGDATIQKLEEFAEQTNDSIYGALLSLEHVNLSSRAKNSLQPFIAMMNNLMAKKEIMGIQEFIEDVINSSGYVRDLEKEDTIESQTRLENIKEFISVAIDFEARMGDITMEEFLANIALLSDVDKTSDSTNVVTMMTIHSAKGLEFPVVFMVGMEDGLFPTFRALDSESDLEEERRLCYVAVTRAERLLYITSAKIRTIYGKTNYTLPSRFIAEMGEAIEKSPKNNEKEQLVAVKDYRTQKETKIIPGTPRPFSIQAPSRAMSEASSKLDLTLGDKVRHKKWGIGTVVQIKDKEGGDKELVITFEQEGLKRLLQSIAPIEVVR